jgi:general secretion pathway protein D
MKLRLALTGAFALHALLSPLGAAAAQPALSPPPSWFATPAPAPIAAPALAGAGWTPPRPVAAAAGDVFEVVQLKYADVSEIVGLLTADQTLKPNDTFMPQEPNFGSAALEGGYYGGGFPAAPVAPGFGPAPAPTESVGRIADEAIGIDRRLNAVILHGPPDLVSRLKQEIAKLDVPVTSVVLETMFVELTATGARNLGFDFNNSNSQIATATYVYSSGYPGLADTPHAGGVAVNLQAAVYAQIAKGNGRIVSKPSISAQSGATAKIVTGDALPILTSIALSGVNAVQQQVQYVNVGVTLQIAPRVGDDGFVTSHVFAVVSSVTGYSQGYPTISQREASTSATVHDGESFVIGGLTQESELTRRSKLPGLGDLPVLGVLLDTENTSRAKTDLYIVVTPHVVRGGSVPSRLPPQS